MLSTTLTPTAVTTTIPTIHRTLSYAEYSAGADADAILELAYELGQVFENSYTPEVLAEVLREVQPQVLLTEFEEDGVTRTDYPIVSDADLDTIDLRACELTTQATCLAE